MAILCVFWFVQGVTWEAYKTGVPMVLRKTLLQGIADFTSADSQSRTGFNRFSAVFRRFRTTMLIHPPLVSFVQEFLRVLRPGHTFSIHKLGSHSSSQGSTRQEEETTWAAEWTSELQGIAGHRCLFTSSKRCFGEWD